MNVEVVVQLDVRPEHVLGATLEDDPITRLLLATGIDRCIVQEDGFVRDATWFEYDEELKGQIQNLREGNLFVVGHYTAFTYVQI